jgi:putative ABC transport system permease protein
MLRAIGMTLGQIKSMIIKEGMTYGLIGALIGTGLGLTCSYLVFIGARDSIVAGMEWGIHIGVVALVLAVTIGITIISTLIPLKKATDMEIVESIRAIE